MTLAVEPGLVVFEGQQYVHAEDFLHTHQEVADRVGTVVLAQRVNQEGGVPLLGRPDILTSDKIAKDDAPSWELFTQQQKELREHGIHYDRLLPPIIGRLSLGGTSSHFSIQPERQPVQRIVFVDTKIALASLIIYRVSALRAIRI